MNPSHMQVNLVDNWYFYKIAFSKNEHCIFIHFILIGLRSFKGILNFFFVNISHIFFARLISRIFNDHILIGSCQQMEKILIYIC